MKHHLKVIAVVVVLLATGGMARAQNITISTFQEKTPPLDIAEKVMLEAYKRIGMTMVVKRLPGDRSIRYSNDGDVDGELLRREGIEQSYPNLIPIQVSISPLVFVVFTKDKQFSVEGWKSLIPYSVGYVRGMKSVELNLVEGTKSDAVTTNEQAFRKLEAGRSDVVVAPITDGRLTIKQFGLTGISILQPPLLTIKGFRDYSDIAI